MLSSTGEGHLEEVQRSTHRRSQLQGNDGSQLQDFLANVAKSLATEGGRGWLAREGAVMCRPREASLGRPTELGRLSC